MIANPWAPIEAPIRHQVFFLSVVVALVVAVAGIIGLLVGHYLALPVATLRRATREIAAGNLSRQVEVSTGDEIEGLANDFNIMTQRLREAHERLSAWNQQLEREVARRADDLHRLQSGLARADKLASIGQMTAGVMHEVGNPLASIKAKIQVAEEDGRLCENCQVLLCEILTEVDRLTMFLRSFSRLAKMREPQMEEVSIADVVQGVMTLVAPELRRRGVLVRVEAEGEEPAIRGDAEQLRQLLINLILNAMEASSRGGEVLVRVGRTTPTAGANLPQSAGGEGAPSLLGVSIEVVDHGAGIPEEILGRIWDPFFTTRPEGTGLGLSICRRIVEDHGGTVQIQSKPGEGTVVTLTFPASRGLQSASRQVGIRAG